MRNKPISIIQTSEKLQREINAIDVFIESVSEKHAVSIQDVIGMLGNKEKSAALIPSFIFRDKLIGILEAVAKYLKENLDMTYHEIAVLLNRDDRVIWVSYNKAIKKKKEKFAIAEPNYWLPVSIFRDTSLGPLEAISKYMTDNAKFKFSKTAKLLNRDNQSIWACYNRAKSKLSKKIKNEKENTNK